MRTDQEIKSEIAALKGLKPIGPHAAKTSRSIQLAIDELAFPFDQTSGEWDELTDSQRDIIHQTIAWKEGESDKPISEGWGGLVK